MHFLQLADRQRTICNAQAILWSVEGQEVGVAADPVLAPERHEVITAT